MRPLAPPSNPHVQVGDVVLDVGCRLTRTQRWEAAP